MQSKAYSKGSACPSIEPGKLRLYSMRFCPYAERALLVAAAKEIPHEIINVDLVNKPEWIFEKNSEGKVPTLEQNGKVLTESLIISDYIDEIFSSNKLTSDDPYQKAVDKILIEKFGKVSGFTNSNLLVLVTGDKDKWNEIFNLLDIWEDELKNRGTSFLSGNKPGMVDYMIWPWFERLESVTLAYNLDSIPKTRFPALTTWISKMFLDPAVKTCHQPPKFYKGYFNSKINGKTDYDFGL